MAAAQPRGLSLGQGVTDDFDVVVIGAGLAGLGAATTLRQQGRTAVILEAADRIGGRAWTTYPEQLGGVWFDMGAMWLHNAEHNPLVPIVEAKGETLVRSDATRTERTFVGPRPANQAELDDYAGAWPRFEAAADRLLQPGMPDVALNEVARTLPDDPWATTVECWEGSVVCNVDAPQYSLLDWKRNVLKGSNVAPQGGIGSFVQRRLGEGLDIRLSTRVTRIAWGGAGGSITVQTDRGTLTARSCIVTVSTGVLRSGAIVFDPPLPPRTQECLDALPMGLAIKVLLRATSADRLDLPPSCLVDRQVAANELLVLLQCWPQNRDYVQGWIGGGTAWALHRDGDAAAIDYTRNELRRLFGGRADRLFDGGATLVTHWGADPLVRGSYAYVAPGDADARSRLAEPLADGHLLFAGEACHVGFAGTLGGAWLSGQAAAALAA
jgi:monoamine oxidase